MNYPIQMEEISANIKITRRGKKLFSIAILMPVWNKIEMDNTIAIDIPLFKLKTFARDEDDAEAAIKEAIESFCIAAERFGNGLESELSTMGWSFIEEEEENSILNYNPHDAVLEQMMQTGETHSHNLV